MDESCVPKINIKYHIKVSLCSIVSSLFALRLPNPRNMYLSKVILWSKAKKDIAILDGRKLAIVSCWRMIIVIQLWFSDIPLYYLYLFLVVSIHVDITKWHSLSPSLASSCDPLGYGIERYFWSFRSDYGGKTTFGNYWHK